VPYSKRVDLMMEREKEKQERLETMRQLQEIEKVTECTFRPRLIKSVRQSAHHPQHDLPIEQQNHKENLPFHQRLTVKRHSGVATTRESLAEQLAREKEEAELQECTFRPKINSNVQVPANRPMFSKPTYSQRYTRSKAAAKQGSSAHSAKHKQAGVFKNYSSTALQKSAKGTAKEKEATGASKESIDKL